MVWSASKVRRRLQIPGGEHLLAWARAEPEGLRVPAPATGPMRRWAPLLALTEDALWVCRSGAVSRFGLDRVVMASIVDLPDGALRVDFLTGDPLVALVADGGAFAHCLTREIRAFDRRLQRSAAEVPWTRPGSGGVRHPGSRDPAHASTDRALPHGDEARDLLREAELIVLRELRTALTESGSP